DGGVLAARHHFLDGLRSGGDTRFTSARLARYADLHDAYPLSVACNRGIGSERLRYRHEEQARHYRFPCCRPPAAADGRGWPAAFLSFVLSCHKYYSAAAMARPSSVVVARPPRSGVRGAAASASTFSIAATIARAASRCPRKSSIRAPDQICPIGFAMPFPAISGADP